MPPKRGVETGKLRQNQDKQAAQVRRTLIRIIKEIENSTPFALKILQLSFGAVLLTLMDPHYFIRRHAVFLNGISQMFRDTYLGHLIKPVPVRATKMSSLLCLCDNFSWA